MRDFGDEHHLVRSRTAHPFPVIRFEPDTTTVGELLLKRDTTMDGFSVEHNERLPKRPAIELFLLVEGEIRRVLYALGGRPRYVRSDGSPTRPVARPISHAIVSARIGAGLEAHTWPPLRLTVTTTTVEIPGHPRSTVERVEVPTKWYQRLKYEDVRRELAPEPGYSARDFSATIELLDRADADALMPARIEVLDYLKGQGQ